MIIYAEKRAFSCRHELAKTNAHTEYSKDNTAKVNRFIFVNKNTFPLVATLRLTLHTGNNYLTLTTTFPFDRPVST